MVIPRKNLSFAVSLLLHLGAIYFLTRTFVDFSSNSEHPGNSEEIIMEAVAISEDKLQTEIKRQVDEEERYKKEIAIKTQQEQERVNALAQESARLKLDVEKMRKAKAEEQKKLAELDEKFQEEQERLKQVKLERDKEARHLAERSKKEAQAKLEAKINQEQMLLQAKRQSWVNSELSRYQLLMKQRVASAWVITPGVPQNLSCKLEIRLLPDGSVVDSKVIQSSGNDAFDKATEVALQRASPLPVPSDPELMDNFRHFTFEFKAMEVLQ